MFSVRLVFQEQHNLVIQTTSMTQASSDQHGMDLQPTGQRLCHMSGTPMTWTTIPRAEKFFKRLESLSFTAVPKRYLHVPYNDPVKYHAHPHTQLFQHPFSIPSHRLFGYSVPQRIYFKNLFSFLLCLLHLNLLKPSGYVMHQQV
jgi:hypothetical protein